MHRSATMTLLGVLASPSFAWVSISQARYGAQISDIRQLYDNTSMPSSLPVQQLLGYLWSQPTSSTSKAGLGGGITWAWDPNLCPSILSRFREDFFFVPFVDCSMLKAAMGRGFASWSANSVHLSFTDVTDECEKIGQLNEDCPLAEVWITSNDAQPASRSRRGLAGTTLTVAPAAAEEGEFALGGSVSAALALPKPVYLSDFRYTNGVKPNAQSVIATVGARVSFNTNLCWYLDSTFCYFFHSVKEGAPSLSASDLHWIVRGVLLAVWLCALLCKVYQIFMVCRAGKDARKGVSSQCHAWIDSLHRRSMIGVAIRLVLLILPPAFYIQIFLPCWDCYDFEAAVSVCMAVTRPLPPDSHPSFHPACGVPRLLPQINPTPCTFRRIPPRSIRSYSIPPFALHIDVYPTLDACAGHSRGGPRPRLLTPRHGGSLSP